MATKNAALQQIAEKIDAHLKRLEKDPKFNKKDARSGTRRFYGAGAYADRGVVCICYTAFHGSVKYNRDRAGAYLGWLDEGNKGTLADYEYLNPKVKEDNLAVIPEGRFRKKLEDEHEYEYADVISAYYAMLEAFSPAIPKKVGSSKYNVPIVPRSDDVCQHTGTLPTFHIMSKDQRKAANKLHDAIREAVLTAYNRGRDHGRDTIAQLVRGEITVGEFEQRPAPPKKRRTHWGEDE